MKWVGGIMWGRGFIYARSFLFSPSNWGAHASSAVNHTFSTSKETLDTGSARRTVNAI